MSRKKLECDMTAQPEVFCHRPHHATRADAFEDLAAHLRGDQHDHQGEEHRDYDWTNGCIAVSNSDMIDIWLMTPNDIPIEIRP